MELILISSNKLKVILNKDEAEKYDIPEIDGTALLHDSKSIHTLLSDIKKMSGFDTENNSLLVEIFESFDGGCEMFITKKTENEKKIFTREEIRDICQTCLCRDSGIAYIFTSAENLMSACRTLYTAKLEAYSSAYLDSVGRYYLLLKSADPFCAMDTRKLLSANEFGEIAKQKYLFEYLSEHATPICLDNAIPTFANI